MDLKYLRFRVFSGLVRPFSDRARRIRMRMFARLMQVKEGMTVLDLGGQPMIWESFPVPLNITILNLPGAARRAGMSQHTFRYVEGDACRVVSLEDRSFDIVFSNSVIEHVGPEDRQAAFAGEVRRLGKSYWVQTPAKWFPIEPHCGMPFWWFYPVQLRADLIERWRKKLPAWTDMVEQTRVLTRSDLRRLFPEATVRTERFLGISKSYVIYHAGVG
jgi:hypothetical protein